MNAVFVGVLLVAVFLGVFQQRRIAGHVDVRRRDRRGVLQLASELLRDSLVGRRATGGERRDHRDLRAELLQGLHHRSTLRRRAVQDDVVRLGRDDLLDLRVGRSRRRIAISWSDTIEPPLFSTRSLTRSPTSMPDAAVRRKMATFGAVHVQLLVRVAHQHVDLVRVRRQHSEDGRLLRDERGLRDRLRADERHVVLLEHGKHGLLHGGGAVAGDADDRRLRCELLIGRDAQRDLGLLVHGRGG